MRSQRLAFGVLTVMIAFCAPARANSRWSDTFWVGPSTNKFAGQIVLDGQFDPSGVMIGLVGDYKIAELGWGFALEGEAELTRNIQGHPYNTISLGIGLRYHGFPWSDRLPTSLAVATGPSFATHPPTIGVGFDDATIKLKQEKWLNYVGIELAVAVPGLKGLDGVIRIFHRSGAFGLYTISADEGSAVGLGIRKRF